MELLGDTDVQRRIYVKVNQDAKQIADSTATEDVVAVENVAMDETVASFTEVSTEVHMAIPESQNTAFKYRKPQPAETESVSDLHPSCSMSGVQDCDENGVLKLQHSDSSTIHYDAVKTPAVHDHSSYSGSGPSSSLSQESHLSASNSKPADAFQNLKLETNPQLLRSILGSSPLGNLLPTLSGASRKSQMDASQVPSGDIPQSLGLLPASEHVAYPVQEPVTVSVPPVPNSSGDPGVTPLPPLTANIFSVPPPELVAPPHTLDPAMSASGSTALYMPALTPVPPGHSDTYSLPTLSSCLPASQTAGGQEAVIVSDTEGGQVPQVVCVNQQGDVLQLEVVHLVVNSQDGLSDGTVHLPPPCAKQPP